MGSTHKTLTLRVWRQSVPDGHPDWDGRFEEYPNIECDDDMSFLEVLDSLNDQLVMRGTEPVAFDFDCREGICGSCGMVINGVAHGPIAGITTCQLHVRHLEDSYLTLEPWRAQPFPVLKDLIIDRSALDTIIEAGGYISVDTGGTPDANEIPIGKSTADTAFDYATCIGCGACVAACRNAAAHLFVGAKVSQLAMLPQGQAEREARVLNMVDTMDGLGFGMCSNEGECEAVCPKSIPVDVISVLNREYTFASIKNF